MYLFQVVYEFKTLFSYIEKSTEKYTHLKTNLDIRDYTKIG